MVIGFICYGIAGLIPISFGNILDCIGISISSIIAAYMLGQLLNSRIILRLYDLLKIRENGKKYLWDNMMDNDLTMMVNVYYDDFIYNGYLFNYESYSNTPNIILVSYMKISNDRIVIEDNSQDKTKVIILDTEKANKIEIVYDKKSKICDEIELFCKCRADNIE